MINNKDITLQFNILLKLTKSIFIIGFIASIFSGFMRFGFEIFHYGTTGGQYALFGFLYILLLTNDWE